MAVLLVELHGIKRGSVLPRRVLIGRRSMNQLVIDDAAVSRMHAWLDAEGDRFYINDTGSRTGTLVNGQRITARHLLGSGDEIRVGPARLTFLAESRLRPGITPIELSPGPKLSSADKGILFDCPSCHAPIWASPSFAGTTGQCKYCGSDLVVPGAKMPSITPPARRPSSSRLAQAARQPAASPVARNIEPRNDSSRENGSPSRPADAGVLGRPPVASA